MVKIGDFGLMIMTDTKITDQYYCCNRLVYGVLCLPAISTESGGEQGMVGMVVQDRPQGWNIESTRFCGPNVVICEVITGVKKTPLISAYLPPSTLERLPDLEEALKLFRDQYPIVLGDHNSNIGQAQNPRIQQDANFLVDFRLMDLLHHFRKFWRFRHMKMWSQVRRGIMVRERCDYILGTDQSFLEMVEIMNISNYPSYHFSLRASLLIYPTESGHQ